MGRLETEQRQRALLGVEALEAAGATFVARCIRTEYAETGELL